MQHRLDPDRLPDARAGGVEDATPVVQALLPQGDVRRLGGVINPHDELVLHAAVRGFAQGRGDVVRESVIPAQQTHARASDAKTGYNNQKDFVDKYLKDSD